MRKAPVSFAMPDSRSIKRLSQGRAKRRLNKRKAHILYIGKATSD